MSATSAHSARTTAFCGECNVERRITGPLGPLRWTLATCGHVAARDQLTTRMDALVASLAAEEIPLGAQVVVWQSTNDGGLKWTLER